MEVFADVAADAADFALATDPDLRARWEAARAAKREGEEQTAAPRQSREFHAAIAQAAQRARS